MYEPRTRYFQEEIHVIEKCIQINIEINYCRQEIIMFDSQVQLLRIQLKNGLKMSRKTEWAKQEKYSYLGTGTME